MGFSESGTSILFVLIEVVFISSVFYFASKDVILDVETENVSTTPAFDGQEFWGSLTDYCNETVNGDSTKPGTTTVICHYDAGFDMNCYVVHDKLHFFKVEVLSMEPILLKYHQLIPADICDRAIEETLSMKLIRARIVSNDTNNPTLLSSSSVSNYTKVQHKERETFNIIFNKLQRTLLAVDLSNAEPFHVCRKCSLEIYIKVMSYHKEGHYAPHFDFLETTDITDAAEVGNRIVTVLLILQSASNGGSTIFPRLNVNVKPGKGDVLVWLNMNVEHRREEKSVHAACPVYDGHKLGATLWVRAFGQEFRLPSTHDKKFPIDAFLKPSVQPLDTPLFTKSLGAV